MTKLQNRDYFFDSARAVLIMLVVFGHLLQPYKDENIYLSVLYLTIYSFHMPAFLFISGYFAKNAGKEGYLEKVSKKLLAPYFIFFVFFSIYYYLTGKEDKVQLDPFDPVFALWFLLTLFFFHIILVIVKNYKPYYVLPIAIIISLLAGYSQDINNYLSFSRTIMFFPVFYIGFLFDQRYTSIFKDKRLVIIAIEVLILFYLIYLNHPINPDWLLGDSPYMSLEGKHDLYSPFKRLLLYFIIFTSMFAFFVLIPTGKLFFTYIGRRTMQVYLLHGLIIGVLRGFKIYPFKEHISILTIIYLITVTALIVFVLSSRFVAKWTNPIIHLKSPAKFKE
ncbi:MULTISPECIES: acyltransferase family protein [Staphylococcus]|uniref:Acyltransferase family protein n=1 Tax=Staphylococcus hsinchuensis TaxID=3051183 RepID=A0ABZ3EA75_9STAP|nr:acyltransferase family protein [Staphylococcus sp. Marseille-Q6910]